MRQTLLIIGLISLSLNMHGQQHYSVHQAQDLEQKSLNLSDEDYYTLNHTTEIPKVNRGGCQLEKVVFGWHPYWSNGYEVNYDWSLISDFSYFSYEVNPNTGDPNSTHGWATNAAVTDALNNGVNVNLCVTLFSSHATLFGNPTATQNLINNLISLVQSRGAHGVNIDFEGIASSQKTNFTNFMIDLSNQMHAAIPGSQVSTVLYAVDWNNVFDIQALDPYVDLFIIMGYGYYYNGSSTSGPTDPLYHFGNNYNFTLSKTVTDYLDKGVTPSKLILGLPYYGYEYCVDNHITPSSVCTSTNGSAKTFRVVENNTSGNYSQANLNYDAASRTRYWNYTSGTDQQCFVVSQVDFAERLDFINKRGIGGMGIWAMGYDDGYSAFWDEIYNHFTTCSTQPCSGDLWDMGGPLKNYYNDENYTYTISPDNASAITLTIDTIDIESNYDYLYIYDGADTSAPQIPGSPFTGQLSGFNFTSSTGDLTFRFTSDGATVTSGWTGNYTCITDNTPPNTTASSSGNWETQDFIVNFTDTDGQSGIDEGYYLVSDYDGTNWSANTNNGFLYDDFQGSSAWTNQTGVWSESAGNLVQTDESSSNTNYWIDLDQNSLSSFLYHWKGSIGGTGNNRRAGIHFFCDDPTLPNRNNSYFVYYRVDSDKVQIYKVINDSWTLEQEASIQIDPAVNYDYKVYFNPISGEITCYLNDQKILTWVDPSPHTAGNSFSFRTGNCTTTWSEVMVYKSRTNQETISIGSPLADVRYQNPSPNISSVAVHSISKDLAGLLSVPYLHYVDVDWTSPIPSAVMDISTNDKDTLFLPNAYEGLWIHSIDPNSGVMEYEYSIGTTQGLSDVLAWTPHNLDTSFVVGSSLFTSGQNYYLNVRSTNFAGLDTIISSDGFLALSADQIEENNNEYFAFPNPFTDQIVLSNLTQSMTIHLYDAQGKMVDFNQHGNVLYGLDNLSSGSYYLLISDGNQIISKIPLLKE